MWCARFIVSVAVGALLGMLVPAGAVAAPGMVADPGAARTIIVGGDRAYAPYEFIDKQGRPAGFNVELTQAIAEVLGISVEVRLGVWDEMRLALVRGDIDLLQGVVHTAIRDAELEFSPRHTTVHQSVFGRTDAPPVTEASQLVGKEVIVQRGGFMHDYLVANKIDAKLILVDNHVVALQMLASGLGDYALAGNLPGLYLSRELGLSNVRPVGKLVAGQPYCYAVRRGNRDLLTQFAEGLAIVKQTGRYEQIYDRWLGAFEQAAVPWGKLIRYGLLVVIPLFALLGATVLWSRTLQHRVAERTQELKVQQLQLIRADKLASLGILVSGVAHEINNPTGLILLGLPMLRRTYQAAESVLEAQFRERGDFMIGGISYAQLRDEMPQMLQDMTEGARRIKRIVDDLKNFARDDSAALHDDVHLDDVVRAALRLVDASIKKATTRLEVVLGSDPAVVRGNAQRIEQVVVNLLLNACQALPDSQRRIVVTTAEQRSSVVLVVQDEGVGIPEDHLSHLTDPFFTTRRAEGGTGLGLSVSAGIIQEHKGTMEFHSVVGAGTTVTVMLPSRRVAE